MFDNPTFPDNILSQAASRTQTGPFVLRPEAPSRLLPAKREDNEVQFVSENPVKKRKLDSAEAAPSPALPLSDNAITLAQPVPDASGNMSTANQPERSVSTSGGNSQLPLAPTEWDPMRGCSMPGLERSGCLATLWTAPATRLHDSPVLSPRQLPQTVSQGLLAVESGQQLDTPLKSESLADFRGADTKPASANFASIMLADILAAAPKVAKDDAADAPAGPIRGLPNGTLEEGSAHQREYIRRQAEHRQGTYHQQPSAPPVQAFEHTSAAKYGAAKESSNNSHQAHLITSSDSTLLASETMSSIGLSRPAVESKLSGVINNVQEPASLPNRPSSNHPPMNNASHSISNAGCKNGPKAKGPCRQCLEDRIRLQAATISAAGMVPATNSSLSNTSQLPPFPNMMQSAWTPPLNMPSYSNGFFSPTEYGQLFPQQFGAGQIGPVPTQHALIPGSAPLNQNNPQPYPSSAKASNITHSQPKPSGLTAIAKTMAPKKPSAHPPQTPIAAKHIIVDIADTCLETFPFEAVAKRHRQPVQKVKDVFDAIIQVPLLRCPTDKRRAGKLGTARVKEYTQAKKDMHSTSGDGGNKQQGSQPGQGYEQFSTWDVAQFLGPSDVSLGAHFNFAGPW